jgi:hypothetical protein
MKSFGKFSVILLVILCVAATESFPYIPVEISATERCDDFRETDELNISAVKTKISRVTHRGKSEISFPIIAKNSESLFHRAPILSESLYLRLRVLRN